MNSPFRKHAAYALDAAVAAFVVLGVVLVFTIGLGGEKATGGLASLTVDA